MAVIMQVSLKEWKQVTLAENEKCNVRVPASFTLNHILKKSKACVFEKQMIIYNLNRCVLN